MGEGRDRVREGRGSRRGERIRPEGWARVEKGSGREGYGQGQGGMGEGRDRERGGTG